MDLWWRRMTWYGRKISPIRPCCLFWFWNRNYLHLLSFCSTNSLPKTESTFCIMYLPARKLYPTISSHKHTNSYRTHSLCSCNSQNTGSTISLYSKVNRYGALAHLDEWQILYFTQATHTHVSRCRRWRQLEGEGRRGWSVMNVAEKHLIEIHGHKYQSPLQRVQIYEWRGEGGKEETLHSIYIPVLNTAQSKQAKWAEKWKESLSFHVLYYYIARGRAAPKTPLLFRHRARPK